MKMFIVLAVAWLLVFVPTTMFGATFYSRQTGNWSVPATWSNTSHTGAAAATTPVSGDDIIIGNGHVVSLNTDAVVRDVTIVSGTLQYDNSITIRSLQINGNLTIDAAGTFTVAVGANSTTDNQLLLGGNVINNGVWTMRPIAGMSTRKATTRFISSGLQTVTGSATATTRLQRVVLEKTFTTSVVDVSVNIGISSAASVNDVIVFTAGTWRQSAGTLHFDDGYSSSRQQSIEVTGALHIVGTANLLFGQSGMSGATFNITGGEVIFNTSSAQPSRFGVFAGNSIHYMGANIGRFILRQGTIIVASRLSRANPGDALHFEQTGGTLILGNLGNNILSARSLFDMPNATSSFSMSGGSIILRNASPFAMPTRPADFFIGNGVPNTFSGGTIQFGDAESSPNQVFSIDVPAATLLNNLTVDYAARLHPFSAAQNLRCSGNILVNGTFNGTQTHPSNPMAATATLTLQGSNSTNQRIEGAGTITLHNLTMNRQGGGTGVAELRRAAEVRGVLNFQEIMPSADPQMLELGSGVDLNITNNAVNAIQNAAESRFVRTSAVSGSLYRSLSGTAEYTFPVGSLGSSMNPAQTFTPLRYRAMSASGGLGVKVFAGSNTTLQGAHRQLPSTATSYARRVWSLAPFGLGGTGTVAAAIPADIAGSAASMSFARYFPNETTVGGAWTLTDTLTSRAASQIEGDWTWREGDTRVFFSRQSGLWSNAASWSFAGHSGEAVPSGITPSRLTDSVIIGGGVNGTNNHVISLQSSVTVSGTSVGTGAANTGTLECTDESWLGGMSFALNDRSTLRIGAAQGITALPMGNGNIRTTVTRYFSPNAMYEYIGAAEQEIGSGVPSPVYALSVTKTLPATLRANRSVDIMQTLSVTSGTFDVQTYTFRNETSASTGLFSLGANAILRIGGTQGFADASTGTVSKYATYSLDDRSTVEFYGTQHVLEPIPNNGFPNNGLPTGGSFGNVSIRASVQAWKPLLLRGSLWVRETARFVNYSPDVRVFGSVYNNASLLNYGVLDVGR